MATSESRPMSSEVFHMALPGSSISWQDLDDNIFNLRNRGGVDPDLLKHQMVDMIPARAPYFVDSGRRLSHLYKILLTNFIDPTNVTSGSSTIDAYKNAIQLVFKSDYSPSGLVLFVNQTREIAKETFNRVSRIRTDCLLNEPAEICARKMALYQSEVDNQNLVYQLSRRYLSGGLTKILANHAKNLNTIMTKSFQGYLSGLRTAVGGRAYMEPYLLTTFEPSNFHCWWNSLAAEAECPTRESAFVQVRVLHTSSDTKTSSSTTSSTFGATIGAKINFVTIGPKASLSVQKGSVRATSETSSTLIEFKLAQVRVYRSWFNPDVFDHHPLGVAETPINFWSDGKFGGIMPSYITKLIVAKDVYIVFSEKNENFESAYQSSTVDAGIGLTMGPFTINPLNYANTQGKESSQSSYNSQSRELYIKGPQIIGYVSSRLPAFPNYAKPK